MADTSLPPSPPLGTLIDNGSLELVELLGQGGYGIVYRAFDTRSPIPISYAVKCLPHAHTSRSSRRRQLHLREIRLHKLASAHPNVVSLHRVVEDKDFTYIVMDYCEDGDLFTQILHQRRYLGQDELVKHVFLQLLDAVDYSHSLGIYHRDLKPENVLCFDGGLRLAITDFGLATTDAFSEEFRTGSAYHMSPECHGGQFAHNGSYSPLFNDVWSLGIILLNLLTGRNPWKSASLNDPTFCAYLQDPTRFLPTVLPISDEVNALLVRVLDVDWRRRLTVTEMKEYVRRIDNFYSDDVVFEGSMARCSWELGMDVGSDTGESQQAEVVEASKTNASVSRWSSDSKSDSSMVYATYSAAQKAAWRPSVSNDETCAVEASMRSSSFPASLVSLPRTRYQTSHSSQSTCSIPSPSASPSFDSLPVTPDDPGATFATKRLTINTDNCATTYYRHSVAMKTEASLSMYTAMEASAIELSPSARLFADFAKTPVREYARHDVETDAEMRDELVDSPFIRVDTASRSSSSGQDSPVLRGRLALSGVRDSKAMDDSESWRSSFYQASRPMSVANDNDADFSLVLDETPHLNNGAFTFNPTLDFFTQEHRPSPIDEKQSWILSWTPADLSSSSYEYDTPSSSSSVSTFFTKSKPIDIPAPATSKQRGERKSRRGGFFRDHIRLTFPRQSDSSQRENALAFSPSSPSSKSQTLSTNNMAEVVSYADTSGLSTSWTRRGRFGGRLTTRTRKNWLLFSPGKLFGNTVTSS